MLCTFISYKGQANFKGNEAKVETHFKLRWKSATNNVSSFGHGDHGTVRWWKQNSFASYIHSFVYFHFLTQILCMLTTSKLSCHSCLACPHLGLWLINKQQFLCVQTAQPDVYSCSLKTLAEHSVCMITMIFTSVRNVTYTEYPITWFSVSVITIKRCLKQTLKYSQLSYISVYNNCLVHQYRFS